MTLRIDRDDLNDVLVEIERSFAIKLPRDMRHVHTASDLHRVIVDRAGPTRGEFCPTQRVFYTLRHGLSAGAARPDMPLASLGLRSPRAMRYRLTELTGLNMPGLAVGRVGCTALLLGPIVAGAAWWTGHSWLIVPALVAALVVLLRFDPGAWSGSWATLGTLSRALAAGNHARLVEEGARHSPATAWHTLVALLDEVMPERVAITSESRLLA